MKRGSIRLTYHSLLLGRLVLLPPCKTWHDDTPHTCWTSSPGRRWSRDVLRAYRIVPNTVRGNLSYTRCRAWINGDFYSETIYRPVQGLRCADVASEPRARRLSRRRPTARRRPIRPARNTCSPDDRRVGPSYIVKDVTIVLKRTDITHTHTRPYYCVRKTL